MQDQVFTAEQSVPLSRDAVFAFFAEPGNLETITPPWLRFRILDQTTPRIEQGTVLTYGLRIHGLPCTWRSRIDEWRPNELFVDVQIAGPYSKWHHTHSFHDLGSGTLIRDELLRIGGARVPRRCARVDVPGHHHES